MSDYEKYQLRWMLEHGYSIKDLIDALTAYQHYDTENACRISTPVNELFAEWEQNMGFGSEIWACEAEWWECEGNANECKVRIESLNRIYRVDTMHYWCNACGEINLPEDSIELYINHTADELPSRELQELYNDYWEDHYICTEYVVTIDGVNGFLFCFLMNTEWMKSAGVNRKDLFQLVQLAANSIFAVPELCGCRFFYGQDTDPDGSEFLVFFPYEERSHISTFRDGLDSGDYNLFAAITSSAPLPETDISAHGTGTTKSIAETGKECV